MPKQGRRSMNHDGGCDCDISSRLERERALVFFIFERALADVIGRETDTFIRRDARAWLFAGGDPPHPFGSALWYANLADMEHVLYACQKVALAAGCCQIYASQAQKTIGLIKRCWCEKAIKARRGGAVRDRGGKGYVHSKKARLSRN